MKRYLFSAIRYVVIIVATTITLPSCDFLELDPISEIPKENMWQNQRDVNAGIAEIYSSFRTAMRTNYFSWGEMRSDNFVLFNELPSEYTNLISNQMTTDLPCSTWASLYKVISNTNFAITHIPSSDITDLTLKNDYLAQAYAMRALCYFYGVRVWGDLPVYLEPVDNIEKGEYKARTSKEQIFKDIIIADLKQAELLINPGNVERKRISRNAIYAIMADAYMWMHEYENAEQIIDKLLSNITYTAFQPDMSELKKTFVDHLNNKVSDNAPTVDEYGPGPNELIFVIHHNVSEAGLSNYSHIWTLLGMGSGEGSTVVLSPKLQKIYEDANAALPSDIRFDNYLCISGGGRTTYQVHKFIANGTRIPYQNYQNCQMAYPIYRMTDVMLMQAEVKAHLDKWQEALNILGSTVRKRAGVEAKTRPMNSFSSRDQLIDYILDEKQIEQVGEGKRWFDLVRNGKAVQVMNPINGMSREAQTLFPIHQTLINQNSELKQNAEY